MSDLNRRIDQLPLEKKALFELLLKRKGLSHQAFEGIAHAPQSDSYPLSFAQQRLWFLDQMEPGNAFYNEPLLAIRIEGPLDRDALIETLNEIVRRHESLRTSFANVEGKPVQIIAPPAPVPIEYFDLRPLPASDREAEMRRLALEEARRPFDLWRGPLLRVSLLQLDEEDHTVFLEMHHIITDGWSNRLLLREIMLVYRARSMNEPVALSNPPIRYVDFAVWQRKWLDGEVLQKLVAHWKQRLGGNLPALELPSDFPRPAVQRFLGRLETHILDPELSDHIRRLATSRGCTLFMTLLASLVALLYRYTRQEDIVIGVPIANRNRGETEDVVGFFVNTLVMRVDASGNPRFSELMERVKQVAVDAYAHEDLPFEKLVEILQPERNLGRQAIFQILFVLHNYPEAAEDPAGEGQTLRLTRIEVDGGESKVDWALSATDLQREGLKAQINYNLDLFQPATIHNQLRQYENLLRHATAEPETRLNALRIFSSADCATPAAEPSRAQRELLEKLKTSRRKPILICSDEGSRHAGRKVISET